MLKRIMRIKLLILLSFTICFQYTYGNTVDITSPAKNFKHLCTLLNTRFELMKEVAAYKYKNKIPIEDKEREQVVLNNSIQHAIDEGISAKSVKSFFETQIIISKHIQENWSNYWNTTGFPKNYIPMDLKEEIRPKLTVIGDEIIKALKLLEKDNKLDLKVKKEIIINTISVKFVNSPEKDKILQSVMDVTKLK